MTRTNTTLLAGLLAAATIAGCGGSEPAEPKATPEAKQAAPASTASPKPAEGIAMTIGEDDEATDYRVNVDSIGSDGAFMALNVTATCEKPPEGDDECSIFSDFTATKDHWTFSGVHLLDRTNQQSFSPVIADDTFWVSNSEDQDNLKRGQSRRFWVKYAAPKEGVDRVDVLFPNGGPVALDVPVEQGRGVDTTPPPAGVQKAGPSSLDTPVDSTDTTGFDLNTGDITARVTSKRAQTVQKAGRRTVTLAADVLFDFDKATLDSEGEKELASVGEDASENADGPVAVDGYTDAKGSDAYNLRLSKDRAKAVADRLEGTVDDLKVTGHGEADPVAPNASGGSDNPKGRARNRRVTVGYAVRTPEPVAPEPTTTPESGSPELPAPVEWDTKSALDEAIHFRAQVLPVRRLGALALASFDVTCTQADETDCGGAFIFSDQGANNVLEQNGGDLRYASGMRLYDQGARATYEPAFGTDGNQLTTETAIGLNRTLHVEAYFLAPPPSVDAITVRLPGGGPSVENVPVQ